MFLFCIIDFTFDFFSVQENDTKMVFSLMKLNTKIDQNNLNKIKLSHTSAQIN